MAGLTSPQTDAILDALYGGRKIEAIQLYREAPPTGLAEAKDFADTLAMELRARHPEKFKAASAVKGCGVVASALAAILEASPILGRRRGDTTRAATPWPGRTAPLLPATTRRRCGSRPAGGRS